MFTTSGIGSQVFECVLLKHGVFPRWANYPGHEHALPFLANLLEAFLANLLQKPVCKLLPSLPAIEEA